MKTLRYNFMLDVYANIPNESKNDSIVMLGDSLTENTPFNEMSGFRHKIINMGISSDNTRGVLNRIESTGKLRPSKVFILLGINDIGNGIELHESMSNYSEIIRILRELSPETRIYLQSVFPVDHKKLADNARCRRRTVYAIRLFNAELIKLAGETKCELIDTYSIFADSNGEMDGNCTADGLHLNGTGMVRWISFLEKYM